MTSLQPPWSSLDRNNPWNILVLGFYHDRLGEDLVFLRPLVKRLKATFPRAFIRIALDHPLILTMDRTLLEGIEVIPPQLKDGEGKSLARHQLAPWVSAEKSLFNLDVARILENYPSDILIDLLDDETSFLRSAGFKVCPYVFRWQNICQGEPSQIFFLNFQGRIGETTKISRRKVYAAVKEAGDFLGLAPERDEPIRLPQEVLGEARVFIEERLAPKGTAFDPDLPIIVLNMFATNNFPLSHGFRKQWEMIAERLSAIRHSYIVVSLGDAQTARWCQGRSPEGARQVADLEAIARKLDRDSGQVVLLDRPLADDAGNQEDSLRRFMGIMSLANFVITPDTGTLHLAHALHKPVILIARSDDDTWLPPQPEIRGRRRTYLIGATEQSAFVDCLEAFQELSVFLQVEAVRRAELKFKAIFDSAGDGIFMFDLEAQRFTKCNQACSAMLGYSEEELRNLTINDLTCPEDTPFYLQQIDEFQRTGLGGIHSDIRVIRKDGSCVNVDLSPALLTIDGKKYCSVILKDITERKRLEEELKRNYDHQRVLNTLLFLSLKDVALEELVRQAFELIFSLPCFFVEPKGAIFLAEEQPPVLVMKAQHGLSEPIRRGCSRVDFGRCICGKAAVTKKTQFVSCLGPDHEITVPGMSPHGHFAVPLVYSRQTLGVMNIYLREDYQYKKEDEEFLDSIANIIAVAIQRKRAGETLRESEEQYRIIFEQCNDGIALVQEDRHILVNAGMCELFGYERPEELIGTALCQTVHPDDLELVREYNRRRQAGEPVAQKYAFKGRRKDGRTIVLEISANRITCQGKATSLAFFREIPPA